MLTQTITKTKVTSAVAVIIGVASVIGIVAAAMATLKVSVITVDNPTSATRWVSGKTVGISWHYNTVTFPGWGTVNVYMILPNGGKKLLCSKAFDKRKGVARMTACQATAPIANVTTSYKLNVEVASADPKVGSMSGVSSGFSVIPAPQVPTNPKGVIPNGSFFFTNSVFLQNDPYANNSDHKYRMTDDQIRGVGFQGAYLQPQPWIWGVIQPNQNTFDFSLTDYQVLAAAKVDLTVIPTIFPYAYWDQGNISRCSMAGASAFRKDDFAVFAKTYLGGDSALAQTDYRCNPQNAELYRKFLQELVERYDGDDIWSTSDREPSSEVKTAIKAHPVQYYEIDTEPVTNFTWTSGGSWNIAGEQTVTHYLGTVIDYVGLLKKTYGPIHEACWDCKVIHAAPLNVGPDLDYYKQVYELGGFDYFDILASHNKYTWADTLHKWLGEKGIRKPFWALAMDRSDRTCAASNLECWAANVIKEVVGFAPMSQSTGVLGELDPLKSVVRQNLGFPAIDLKTQKNDTLVDYYGNKTVAYQAVQLMATKLRGYSGAVNISDTTPRLVKYKITFSDREPVWAYWSTADVISVKPEAEVGNCIITPLFGSAKEYKAGESFQISSKDNVYFVQKKI